MPQLGDGLESYMPNNVCPFSTLRTHLTRLHAYMKFDRCLESKLERTGIEDFAILPKMNCFFSELTPKQIPCRIWCGLPVGGFFPQKGPICSTIFARPRAVCDFSWIKCSHVFHCMLCDLNIPEICHRWPSTPVFEEALVFCSHCQLSMRGQGIQVIMCILMG